MESTQKNSIQTKNRQHFLNELKLYINRRLFERRIITEDMYLSARDSLLRQAIHH